MLSSSSLGVPSHKLMAKVVASNDPGSLLRRPREYSEGLGFRPQALSFSVFRSRILALGDLERKGALGMVYAGCLAVFSLSNNTNNTNN